MVDASGVPVENAQVWVSYPLKNFREIHIIGVAKDKQQAVVRDSEITWPLRVTIR